jgi:hypothetical protein
MPSTPFSLASKNSVRIGEALHAARGIHWNAASIVGCLFGTAMSDALGRGVRLDCTGIGGAHVYRIEAGGCRYNLASI